MLLRADLGEKGSEHRLRVRVMNADLKELQGPPEISITVPHANPIANPDLPIILAISNFTFFEFGEYELHVLVNGTVGRTINLFVQPIARPESI